MLPGPKLPSELQFEPWSFSSLLLLAKFMEVCLSMAVNHILVCTPISECREISGVLAYTSDLVSLEWKSLEKVVSL